MNKNTTETEVLTLAKIKPNSKEGRQKFLGRCLDKLTELFGDGEPNADDNWEKASGDVQKWYTAAGVAHDSEKPLPDFDGKDTKAEAEPTKEAKSNGKAKEPEQTKKEPAKSAKAPAKEKEKAKETKAKEAKQPRTKSGKVTKIQSLAFSNPKKGVDELTDMLAKKGIETSRATVWSVRTALMRDVAFLHGEGLLKENPFA